MSSMLFVVACRATADRRRSDIQATLENCGACGRVLRTSKLMMEVRKSTMVFFFHGDCYLLWIDERRAPVVTSSAFARLA
jgi:hypothetical protein